MKRGAHPKGAEPPQAAPAASIHDTTNISVANGWMWQGLAIIVGILVVIAVIYKLHSSRTTAKKTIAAKPTDAKEAEEELADSCSESSSKLLHAKDSLELPKRASSKGYDEATDEYHQTDSTPVDRHQTVPKAPRKSSSIPQGDVPTAKVLDIQEHKDSFQPKGTDIYSDAYEIAPSSSEDQRLAAGEHKESRHKPERGLKNDTEIISEGTSEHTVAVVTEDIKAGESETKGEDTLSSTSKILKKEKRRSSVGESLRKFWKSKKGAVVTKSEENVTEGTSILASISSELSDTTHTTVDRSEVLQQPVFDTSTIPKVKRRKSSVGEVFKKIWNPKKGMVDSKALENLPEDNYIDNGLPSQEHGTEGTKIDSVTFATDTLREDDDTQKATSSHMKLKHLGNESDKVEAIDGISAIRPSSADAVAKGSISDDQESLRSKISQESKTIESFLRADQSQENEETTLTPKALKDETCDASIAPAERRKSSLADAIDWLWNLTTTEAETTKLEPLTEDGPIIEDLPSEDTRAVDVETESGIQPESHTIHIKMDSTVSFDKVEATHTRKTSVIKPIMLPKISDAITEVPSTSTSEDLQRKEMECIERSSSAEVVSKDSVKLVEDKEHIHSKTTDASYTTRAEDDIVEKDIHGEASQEPEQPEEEDITFQASEPETITDNLAITKPKRRKSSVAEALRKIWNPKKSPVDTQSRENLAEEVSTKDNIDVQTREHTDAVNVASDSEFHLEWRNRSMKDTKKDSKLFDDTESATQLQSILPQYPSSEVSREISSTGISGRKESLSSNRAMAKDIDLESQESEKTIEEPEGDKVQGKETQEALSTSNILATPETERRRSSLADAINWLWNLTITNIEKENRLENLTEEGNTSEVLSSETKNVERESEIHPESQKRSTTEVTMGLNLSFDKGEPSEIEDAIEPIMLPPASLDATNEASRTNMLNEREGNSCDQLKGQHEDFGTSDGSSSSCVAVDLPDDKLLFGEDTEIEVPTENLCGGSSSPDILPQEDSIDE